MPPLLFSPLLKIGLGAVGAAAIVHWVAKEVRRINAEIDRVSSAPAADAVVRQALPTLRRDARSGEWRVM
jgi:hypothetical protein